MNRLLSVLVAIFVLFLLYIWINHLMNSPEASSPDNQEQIASGEDNEDQYPLSNYSGKQHFTLKTEDDSVEAAPIESEQEKDKEAAPEQPPAKKPEKVKPEPTPRSQNADISQGEHLVIAGNFLDRANAQKRVDELKSFGYANAEIVNFELSEYHTACAGRFANLPEARRIAKKIEDTHNIDTYVRNGNQP
jgi:cell division septation protein DedD